MSDYKLTRWELSDLMHLNFDLSYLRQSFYYNNGYGADKKGWKNPDQYISSLQTTLSPFLNPLLQKQPDLAPYLELYWEKCKVEAYAEHVFDEVFDNKILLKNVYQYILKDSYSRYVTDKDRKKFIKNMINHEPWLLNEAHNLIKNNNVKDNMFMYAYAESLTSHVKEIQDSKESIWDNLKKAQHYSDSTSTALLTSVIKAFSHDKDYYLALREVFAPQFEKYHGLREKFQKYEKKHFSDFQVKETFDLFENQAEYRYCLNMMDRVLIDNYGIHKGAVEFIKRRLNECIETYLAKVMPSTNISFLSTQRGLEIILPNLDDKDTLHINMNKFQPVIVDMISSLDKNTKQFPNKGSLDKFFEASVLKLEMEDSLDKKEEVKPKRSKL